MRLILACLAVAQVRLARLDIARATMLAADADAAFARSRERVAVAERMAQRAGLPALANCR